RSVNVLPMSTVVSAGDTDTVTARATCGAKNGDATIERPSASAAGRAKFRSMDPSSWQRGRARLRAGGPARSRPPQDALLPHARDGARELRVLGRHVGEEDAARHERAARVPAVPRERVVARLLRAMEQVAHEAAVHRVDADV